VRTHVSLLRIFLCSGCIERNVHSFRLPALRALLQLRALLEEACWKCLLVELVFEGEDGNNYRIVLIFGRRTTDDGTRSRSSAAGHWVAVEGHGPQEHQIRRRPILEANRFFPCKSLSVGPGHWPPGVGLDAMSSSLLPSLSQAQHPRHTWTH
jgi:hypothetical protein